MLRVPNWQREVARPNSLTEPRRKTTNDRGCVGCVSRRSDHSRPSDAPVPRMNKTPGQCARSLLPSRRRAELRPTGSRPPVSDRASERDAEPRSPWDNGPRHAQAARAASFAASTILTPSTACGRLRWSAARLCHWRWRRRLAALLEIRQLLDLRDQHIRHDRRRIFLCSIKPRSAVERVRSVK